MFFIIEGRISYYGNQPRRSVDILLIFRCVFQVLELRRQIEKQSTDIGAAHRSLSDLRSKNAELEERLIQINKEMHQSQEIAKSLECELNENVAQKGDQEERIATLEKRSILGWIIIIYNTI